MRRRLLAAGLVALLVGVGATGCSEGKKGSAQELCAVVGSGSFADLFQKGLDPTDTDRALAQLRAAAVDLDQLHAAAPSDVRGAVADEIAYVAAVTKVLQDVDPGDPAAVVDAVNALKDERTAAQAASVKLRAYQDAHCTGTPTSS